MLSNYEMRRNERTLNNHTTCNNETQLKMTLIHILPSVYGCCNFWSDHTTTPTYRRYCENYNVSIWVKGWTEFTTHLTRANQAILYNFITTLQSLECNRQKLIQEIHNSVRINKPIQRKLSVTEKKTTSGWTARVWVSQHFQLMLSCF